MNDLDDYIDLAEQYDRRFDRPDECRCDEQLTAQLCYACWRAGFGTPNVETTEEDSQ